MQKIYLIILSCLFVQNSLENIENIIDQNFEDFIQENQITIVLINSNLNEKQIKQIDKFQNHFNDNNVKFGQINVNQNFDFKKRYFVQRDFKMIIFFQDLEFYIVYPFQEITQQNFTNFVQNLQQKNINIFREDYIKNYNNNQGKYGIFVYCGKSNTEYFEILQRANKSIMNINIFQIKNINECQSIDLKQNQLVFIKNDNKKTYYQGDIQDKLKLINFLKFNKFLFLNKFTHDLIGECIQDNIPLIIYTDRNLNQDFLDVLHQVHQQFKYHFVIAFNNMKTEEEIEYLNYLQMDTTNYPSLLITFIDDKVQKFEYKSLFNYKSISQFLLQFVYNQKFKKFFPLEHQRNSLQIQDINYEQFQNLVQNQQIDKVIYVYDLNSKDYLKINQLLQYVKKKLQNKNLYFAKINQQNLLQEKTQEKIYFYEGVGSSKIHIFENEINKINLENFVLSKHERRQTELQLIQQMSNIDKQKKIQKKKVSSLSKLTKDIVNSLKTSKNNTIDLDQWKVQMKGQKRRVYDIINVLEGLGKIQKKGKTKIQLIDEQDYIQAINQQEQLKKQIQDLKHKKSSIDLEVSKLKKEIQQIEEKKDEIQVDENTLSVLFALKNLEQPYLIIESTKEKEIDYKQIKEGVNLTPKTGRIFYRNQYTTFKVNNYNEQT